MDEQHNIETLTHNANDIQNETEQENEIATGQGVQNIETEEKKENEDINVIRRSARQCRWNV